MTRKRTHRRVIVPLPPRGLRPKLDVDQVRDLALCHVQNLDAMARGDATETTLWHIVEAVMTWSRVSELIGAGEPEMLDQVEMVVSVVQRYGRTGRLGFSGTEYQTAKDGMQVMDQLAAIVDRPSALAAVAWSENRVRGLKAECRSVNDQGNRPA